MQQKGKGLFNVFLQHTFTLPYLCCIQPITQVAQNPQRGEQYGEHNDNHSQIQPKIMTITLHGGFYEQQLENSEKQGPDSI